MQRLASAPLFAPWNASRPSDSPSPHFPKPPTLPSVSLLPTP
ncbi:hypothetical protein BJP36_43320 [Moorena producens JHB]|uniref:Uncharacterized protein n=1 Tax=Moorena producens (strain JHB) TaxID=1454205 RepID=A0A9Q9ST60_MOOP1|nr:hypothetical protein [Moorena producens]WAN69194.1 hypothetical protein BJP36_43320 [Moorena producens JHB]